jgi:hypothetical protein
MSQVLFHLDCAWVELKKCFLASGDGFKNGTFPRSWLKYFVCRASRHRPVPYISGAGFDCEECSRCGKRERIA